MSKSAKRETVNPKPEDVAFTRNTLVQRSRAMKPNSWADLYYFSLLWFKDGRNILRYEMGINHLTEQKNFN